MLTQEGQIGLVNLVDYNAFLDEGGEIGERIFDSNVRGYWKSTPVNTRIATTLGNPKSSEFWLLNNGITILAEKIDNAPEFLQIEITDPQIVNGLQTSRQIFNYYKAGQNLPAQDARRVLVRIIKTIDKTVRDEVIRCTNSQNEMPEESLRATDEIHRQIETLFHTYNLFYDRRKGHYKDQGKPVTQIVSVVEVLQAMLSVVLMAPDDARARPRDYFKKNDKYSSVFGKEKYNLNLYLKSTQILRRVESYLENLDLELIHRRNINFYLCMYVSCAKAANAFAPAGGLLALDVSTLTDEFLKECYGQVWKHYQKLADKLAVDGERDFDSLAKGPHLLKALSAELKRRFKPKKKN
jgi:hypothetical protein